jgi:predicted nuclease of predicted toxin-antitoxin system
VKLLLDQNLSFKLVPALEDLYPGSIHVRSIELSAVSVLGTVCNKNP